MGREKAKLYALVLLLFALGIVLAPVKLWAVEDSLCFE